METVKLDKLVPGGQALGQLADGRKVFVWGGLPGETVEIEITKSKKSYAEAVVMTVIAASEHRIEPRDVCYLSTSPWQIMDYDYELEQKAELVKEAFRQDGIILPCHSGLDPESSNDKLTIDWTPDQVRGDGRKIITDGIEFGYRNKMEYSLYWDNNTNRIELAFHKRGSHQKVPIESSSIERPEILAEARTIVAELNANGDEARRYQSLMVRANQNREVSAALFENGKPHPQMKLLTDTILGREYTYSPNGFFQINLPVYELALSKIKEYIDPNLPIVDMYSGVGTIGLSVANKGFRLRQPGAYLTLVETNKDAFRELEANMTTARHSGLDPESSNKKPSIDWTPDRVRGDNRIEPVLSDAENALEYITGDINLIVDPPRAGLNPAVVDKILDAKPAKVIYLSCNPTTQARDVAKLLPRYKIVETVGYNFFPRTPHIENLIVLERVDG